MKEETFQLDFGDEDIPVKPKASPTPPKNKSGKYTVTGQALSPPGVPPARSRAPRLIAEDPEKRRIVGRVRAAPRKAQASVVAAEQAPVEPIPTSPAHPEPPAPVPPPPVFEGGGLAKVGTLRKQKQADDEDEFSYAFEGGRREEGFHKQVFRPKAMPAHLVSNVKQRLNTEVLAEEEEEAEEEDEQEEEEEATGVPEVEEQDEFPTHEMVTSNRDTAAAAELNSPASPSSARNGAEEEVGQESRQQQQTQRQEQLGEDDNDHFRSKGSVECIQSGLSRLSSSPKFTPNGMSPLGGPRKPDMLGSGFGLASGTSGAGSSAVRSSTSSQPGGGTARGPRQPSDGCGSTLGSVSERAPSGGEDVDVMRLSNSQRDNKPGSWTTFAVSDGQMDCLQDDAIVSQVTPVAADAQPSALQPPERPAEDELPSYKLMQALHVTASHATGGLIGGTTAVAFNADQSPGTTADIQPYGGSRGPLGSNAGSVFSPSSKVQELHHGDPLSEEQPTTVVLSSAVIVATGPAGGSAGAAAAPASTPPSTGETTAAATATSDAAVVLVQEQGRKAAEVLPVAGAAAGKVPELRPVATSPGASKPKAIEDEWDVAMRERQNEMGAKLPLTPVTGARTPGLTYHTALVHFMAMDTSCSRISVAAALPPPPGFFARMLCMGPPDLRPPLLREQLMQLLSLARLAFNDEDPMHVRLLGSLYGAYTGKGCEPPRFGSHWAELGFQGQDPATDLRGCGMLGLLQLYYLTQWSLVNADKMYRLSHHPVQEFPLAIVSLNVTKWTLQALRGGLLHREANTHGSVLEAAQQYYAGCMATFYSTWLQGHKTMVHSGHVLKDLETLAMKKPNAMLAAAQVVELPDPPSTHPSRAAPTGF